MPKDSIQNLFFKKSLTGHLNLASGNLGEQSESSRTSTPTHSDNEPPKIAEPEVVAPVVLTYQLGEQQLEQLEDGSNTLSSTPTSATSSSEQESRPSTRMPVPQSAFKSGKRSIKTKRDYSPRGFSGARGVYRGDRRDPGRMTYFGPRPHRPMFPLQRPPPPPPHYMAEHLSQSPHEAGYMIPIGSPRRTPRHSESSSCGSPLQGSGVNYHLQTPPQSPRHNQVNIYESPMQSPLLRHGSPYSSPPRHIASPPARLVRPEMRHPGMVPMSHHPMMHGAQQRMASFPIQNSAPQEMHFAGTPPQMMQNVPPIGSPQMNHGMTMEQMSGVRQMLNPEQQMFMQNMAMQQQQHQQQKAEMMEYHQQLQRQQQMQQQMQQLQLSWTMQMKQLAMQNQGGILTPEQLALQNQQFMQNQQLLQNQHNMMNIQGNMMQQQPQNLIQQQMMQNQGMMLNQQNMNIIPQQDFQQQMFPNMMPANMRPMSMSPTQQHFLNSNQQMAMGPMINQSSHFPMMGNSPHMIVPQPVRPFTDTGMMNRLVESPQPMPVPPLEKPSITPEPPALDPVEPPIEVTPAVVEPPPVEPKPETVIVPVTKEVPVPIVPIVPPPTEQVVVVKPQKNKTPGLIRLPPHQLPTEEEMMKSPEAGNTPIRLKKNYWQNRQRSSEEPFVAIPEDDKPSVAVEKDIVKEKEESEVESREQTPQPTTPEPDRKNRATKVKPFNLTDLGELVNNTVKHNSTLPKTDMSTTTGNIEITLNQGLQGKSTTSVASSSGGSIRSDVWIKAAHDDRSSDDKWRPLSREQKRRGPDQVDNWRKSTVQTNKDQPRVDALKEAVSKDLTTGAAIQYALEKLKSRPSGPRTTSESSTKSTKEEPAETWYDEDDEDEIDCFDLTI